eukprot:scaffold937_cov181-Cylindrotheca_fusiformis.AAC.2
MRCFGQTGMFLEHRVIPGDRSKRRTPPRLCPMDESIPEGTVRLAHVVNEGTKERATGDRKKESPKTLQGQDRAWEKERDPLVPKMRRKRGGVSFGGLGGKEGAIDPIMRQPALKMRQPGVRAMEIGRIRCRQRSQRETLNREGRRSKRVNSGVRKPKQWAKRRKTLKSSGSGSSGDGDRRPQGKIPSGEQFPRRQRANAKPRGAKARRNQNRCEWRRDREQ